LACRASAQPRRETTGKTPLLQLKGERIFAKAEFFNSGGGIKHRGVEN
jgi:cysteine synthase